jgi:hypothetical protein
MPIDDEMPPSTWSRFSERVGVTLWTSFLAACLETLVFFAYFDPMVLGSVEATPSWLALRPAAYAAGFFFFWIFTILGSSLTAYMLDSSPNTAAKAAARIK